LAGTVGLVHRDLIIALAARYRLPAIYTEAVFSRSGGLISFGYDRVDDFRNAASCVDRILRGEKPSDLPVQGSTKLELTVNLKTSLFHLVAYGRFLARSGHSLADVP
jgi:putative tryptophan/tyrosine transport system substrate-binding protein